MKFINATIKSRLVSTAIGITLILVSLGIITNINLKNTFKQYSLLSIVDAINTEELEIRKYEKDFLLKETSNTEFYKTKNSVLLDSLYSTLKNVESEIFFLKEDGIISNLGLFQNVTLIENGFEDYRHNFDLLKTQIIQKGFEDFGLVGQMRAQIHSVEGIVEEQNNLQYSKLMLTLRRHEKDYLLRKDLKYRDRFDKVVDEFTKVLEVSRSQDAETIAEYLGNYQDIFHRVIEKDMIIGLKEDRGLMNSLNESIVQIEKNLAILYASIYENSKRKISKATLMLFLLIGFFSITILVFIYRDSKYIVNSINSLRQYINRLGKGELPGKIEVVNTDEISDMKRSINELTKNLKQTRDFVIEVGNGNFKEEINVFNGEGELGSNLILMRKKLLQVQSEREQQQIESERRIWNNEGIGLFADILRSNNNNIEDLSFEIIKNLVQYLNANQGGVFIRNKEDKSDVYFNLTAAYAYDRKKFLEKRVSLGEGMLGTCAIEAKTVYMTEIPNHYIEITSGLGGANPSSLLIVPLKREEEVLGMIEIASFNKLEKHEIEFVEKIAENVASQLYFVQMNIKTNNLLEETKSQAEEMLTQEEEMRQNMEELTVTQERLASREEELLREIEELKIKNTELFQKLGEDEKTQSEFDYESSALKN